MLISPVGSSSAFLGDITAHVTPASQPVAQYSAALQSAASLDSPVHPIASAAPEKVAQQPPKVHQPTEPVRASEPSVEFELFRYLTETPVNTDPSSRPLLDGLENALGNFQKAAGKLMDETPKSDALGAWKEQAKPEGNGGSTQPNELAKHISELENLMQHSKEIMAAAFSVSITTGSVGAANAALNSLVRQQ